MTTQNILVLMFAVGVNTAVALMARKVLCLFEKMDAKRGFNLYALLSFLWIGGVWFAVFVTWGFPVSGDVVLFFQPQGRAFLEGKIPLLDFPTSYSILFPLVMGLVDKAWSDSRSIGLFFAGCLWVSALILGRIVVTQKERPPGEQLILALAGIVNGAMAILAIGYQQDETWMLLWVAVSLYLLLRGKEGKAGLALGLGLLMTKVLFGIFCISLLPAVRKRHKFLFGLLLPLIPTSLLLLARGLSPLSVISVESGAINPPSLVSTLTFSHGLTNVIRNHSLLIRSLMGGVVVTLAVLTARGRLFSARTAFSTVTVAWLVFLILSPKSLTSYRIPVLALLPCLLSLFRGPLGKDVLWVVYNSAVAVEYMLYEDWIRKVYFPYYKFLQHVWAVGHVDWRAVFVMGLDLTIVLSEILFVIWLVQEGLQRLSTPGDWTLKRFQHSSMDSAD